MFQDRLWLQDFDALPPEKQAAVIDFIQFLRNRKSQVSGQVSQDSSPAQQTDSAAGCHIASFLERAKDLIGSVDDAPSDLVTHPRYKQSFGE